MCYERQITPVTAEADQDTDTAGGATAFGLEGDTAKTAHVKSYKHKPIFNVV